MAGLFMKIPKKKGSQARLIDYMGREAIPVNKLEVTRTKELEFLVRTEYH